MQPRSRSIGPPLHIWLHGGVHLSMWATIPYRIQITWYMGYKLCPLGMPLHDTCIVFCTDYLCLLSLPKTELTVVTVGRGGASQGSSVTAIEFQGASIVLPPELFEATQLSSGLLIGIC